MSIGEWISITRNQEEKYNIPITLHTTSGSMQPYVRINIDTVTVVPCTVLDVKTGDIILIRNEFSTVGYLLHRLYRMDNGKIITIGDNNIHFDLAVDENNILGRAVSIIGPDKKINCNSRWRQFQGRVILHTIKLRPYLFFVRRAANKCERIIGKLRNKQFNINNRK